MTFKYPYDNTMVLNSQKILIGLFSYNENENLKKMFYEVKKQTTGLNCTILLIDESDESNSLAVVDEIMSKEGVINIAKGGKRMGKVHGYNLLYTYFLKSDYTILLHFDVDHVLSENAVPFLANSIDSGFDIATCLNKPFQPENLFQRIQYIMITPSILQREHGTFNLPLVGHNGAYSRKMVSCIGNVPGMGIDEETYILSKVLAYHFSYIIVKNAISYFTLPKTLPDYIRSTRRVYGKVKAFNKWYSRNKEDKISSKHNSIEKNVYSLPPIKLVVKSVFLDPLASTFLPFMLVVRWAIMTNAKVYNSDTWETIETTKVLGGGGSI